MEDITLKGEIEMNSVTDGLYTGERIIKKEDGFYIGGLRLSKDTYNSIQKLPSNNNIGSSFSNKIKSNIKTTIGTLTGTLPLYADSAKEDAGKVMIFAIVKWKNGDASTLYLKEDIYKEITGRKDVFDIALGAGVKIQDFGKNTADKIKLKILNPVFEEEYKDPKFNLPSVIKIVDSVVRANEKLCEGAVGWREKIDNLEVLQLYNTFVKSSGVTFTPSVQCNAIYYENPHVPNQYIMLDELFPEVQNARAAELEQVAYNLGAKYFRVELTDTKTIKSQKESKASTSANALNYVKAEASVTDNSDSYEKSDRYIMAETHFADKREPCKPELLWFAENPKINSLIKMRLGKGDMQSHDILIRCSSYSVMNSETAGNLDAVIKKIGAKANANIKKHFEKERNQVMIFHIEFYIKKGIIMDNVKILKPEDYEEPDCLLCMDDKSVTPINTRRFIKKLDEYYGRNDYGGAERHLKYWLNEAQAGGDLRGQFTVYNEMMGYYRKQNRFDEAVYASERALSLISKLGIAGQVSAGTAYVNTATVYKTFNMSDAALPWFLKAKEIYEKELNQNDGRLGGLYNNMALSLCDMKRYDEATSYYKKAIEIMLKNENGELEAAISYLNMANAAEAAAGLEAAEAQISEYLDTAMKLLDTPGIKRNGYYAFVCEKCAPTFSYYGYFLYADKLKKTAGEIYERA